MNHDVLRAICVSLVALTAVAVGGCGGGPTRFELNTEGREPGSIGRAQREAIRDTMTELFGTPDEPRVPPGVGLDVALLRRAAGPVYSDESGVGFGLYRKHCSRRRTYRYCAFPLSASSIGWILSAVAMET